MKDVRKENFSKFSLYLI